MTLTPTIIARIEGQHLAKDAIELLRDCLDESTIESPTGDRVAAFTESYWLTIKDEAETHIPAKHEPKPSRPTMGDDDAKRFENKRVGFGIHADKTYADCPTDYLLFLARNAEELLSYLRSERGQRRQDEDE